ncbi:MAG: DNA (cytosine-5-)-methyltransferase [Leadbetterella sp.]|nr:DNA (cytosine-5-)-methyltransferase [Leadbetterella sp.]
MGNKLTVIDFFCGAGGFSEGFKQMGFEIKYGYDHWKPAVDTYNHNFNLECKIKNILDFKHSTEEIENLPDTDVIIGSPPCVSFSSSNKSGNADKSLGLELTEAFLRVVAIKKHQPNSILKAWFMENVVNSKRYLQPQYTFKDLGLEDWAKKHRIGALTTAIDLYDNTTVINSADYGSIQSRKRVISGEIIKKKKLIVPPPTHQIKESELNLPLYNSINLIKRNFPSPYEKKSSEKIKDIQYPIEIDKDKITDHFYDTGVYEIEWKFSKYWKTNHPFMGKMSFPENENKPSRTITATKIANSRESIIYKSEIKRSGDGEFRLPTVREAAIIMGFPITYQFLASENNKWRLVGNAVCCSVSRAFAKVVLKELRLNQNSEMVLVKKPTLEGVLNLNNFTLKTFDNPPVKNEGSRFRRHPLKEGNLTVTLSNYDIEKSGRYEGKWLTSIQYGTGKGFPIQHIEDGYYENLESIISKYKSGKKFIEIINNGFTDKIGNAIELQNLYELQKSSKKYTEPTELVDLVQTIINMLQTENIEVEQKKLKIFKHKEKVPVKQIFALYAINKISTIANKS